MKKLLTIMLVTVAVLLTGCGLRKHFVHKSLHPMSGLPGFQSQFHVREVWSRTVGKTGRQYVRLNPAFSGDKIFVVSRSGDVYALNIHNGRQLWKARLHEKVAAGLSANRSSVVVATENGAIIALNKANGAVQWRHDVVAQVFAAPFAASDMVVVKTADDHVLALDSQSGKVMWQYQQKVPDLILRGESAPVVAKHLVLAGFSDGHLLGLSQKHGVPLWQVAVASPKPGSVIERMVDIDDTPVVSNGVIYVAGYQGNLVAIDLDSGKVNWRKPVSSISGVAVDGGSVYVTDIDGRIGAYNRASGGTQWQQNALLYRGLSKPALMNKSLVVGDAAGYLHWMSLKNGKFQARTLADKGGFVASPVLYHGLLYVYTAKGRLKTYQVY